jgi:hypothetical protein
MSTINEQLEEAMKEFGKSGGGNFYKVQEGNENVIRVLTQGAPYASIAMGGNEYRTLYGREKGDPLRSRDDYDAEFPGRILPPVDKEDSEASASIRTVVYVIDRRDGRIKQAELAYSVMKKIGALQENPDYKFSEYPMPYDIRITFDKSKKFAAMYEVNVKPESPGPTSEQRAELDEKMKEYSPEKVVQGKKQRQIDEDERRGMRISEEDLKKAAEAFNNGMQKAAREQAQKHPEDLPTVQYPGEDINPEDIPF